MAEIWETGEVERLGDLLTDDYVGHMLGLGDRHGVAEYAATISRFRASGAAAHFEVLDQFSEGDKVCTRVRSRRSDGAGGEEVAYGINVSSYRDGRLAEGWAIWTPWARR